LIGQLTSKEFSDENGDKENLTAAMISFDQDDLDGIIGGVRLTAEF
jgi:hypothetical protein